MNKVALIICCLCLGVVPTLFVGISIMVFTTPIFLKIEALALMILGVVLTRAYYKNYNYVIE